MFRKPLIRSLATGFSREAANLRSWKFFQLSAVNCTLASQGAKNYYCMVATPIAQNKTNIAKMLERCNSCGSAMKPLRVASR